MERGEGGEPGLTPGVLGSDGGEEKGKQGKRIANCALQFLWPARVYRPLPRGGKPAPPAAPFFGLDEAKAFQGGKWNLARIPCRIASYGGGNFGRGFPFFRVDTLQMSQRFEDVVLQLAQVRGAFLALGVF